MKANCAECAYYAQTANLPEGVALRGFCRRFPPVVFLNPSHAIDTISALPVVMADAFCGEFKPAQPVN